MMETGRLVCKENLLMRKLSSHYVVYCSCRLPSPSCGDIHGGDDGGKYVHRLNKVLRRKLPRCEKKSLKVFFGKLLPQEGNICDQGEKLIM